MGAEPARYVPDGTEGIYVVVGASGDDVLLCHVADHHSWDRDEIRDLVMSGKLDASDYDVACHPDRITTDLTRTER
jgi:hypothetical protein